MGLDLRGGWGTLATGKAVPAEEGRRGPQILGRPMRTHLADRLRPIRDRLLYWRFRSLKKGEWRKRHRKVLDLHPEYKAPCSPSVEREHLRLWKHLCRRVDLSTLRICANISGSADSRVVPEDIFASEIEPFLGRRQWYVFIQHKSFYERFLPIGNFPSNHFHNIDGQLFTCDFHPIELPAVRNALDGISYPVVVKPNTGSSGGEGVDFAENAAKLWDLMKASSDFVVQPLLRQHSFFSQFNDKGLNTCRVDVYRSVDTGEYHVLNVGLRMGLRGSLDNETAGGIVCAVSDRGTLNKYAVDKYGARFLDHPDSGVSFQSAGCLPKFPALLALAKEVASRIPGTRLVALDFFYDAVGRWRGLEVNVGGATIRFAQYAGRPFFGKFTDEVLNFSMRHERRGRVQWQLI